MPCMNCTSYCRDACIHFREDTSASICEIQPHAQVVWLLLAGTATALAPDLLSNSFWHGGLLMQLGKLVCKTRWPTSLGGFLPPLRRVAVAREDHVLVLLCPLAGRLLSLSEPPSLQSMHVHFEVRPKLQSLKPQHGTPLLISESYPAFPALGPRPPSLDPSHKP